MMSQVLTGAVKIADYYFFFTHHKQWEVYMSFTLLRYEFEVQYPPKTRGFLERISLHNAGDISRSLNGY